ncbi:hypothetical protein METHB2_70075 [Candidatus Methylobacter favarea]|uniref:Uncharacterized protein n=1 Tax=Candidatus Methylobacter favarea TaxID=2707345 RepID=A0A8S0XUV5_9GAMM|nr:hypothetical protein METHB2_70075 [Candidatus Methylobacter favarea]
MRSLLYEIKSQHQSGNDKFYPVVQYADGSVRTEVEDTLFQLQTLNGIINSAIGRQRHDNDKQIRSGSLFG